MVAGKVKMTQEDKAYFKSGEKTLCGTELILATKVINDPDIKRMFTQGDLDFMNKELGRRAGAIFAEILRGFKKKDFAEVQKILTGGKKNENYCSYQHERRMCQDHDNGKYGSYLSQGLR